MNYTHNIIFAAGIMAIAAIVSVLIFTQTWSSNYRLNQTISVTGSAKETLTSDLGILKATINTKSSTAKEAFQMLENQKPPVVSFFKENGFRGDGIVFHPPNNYSQEEYDQNGRPTGQILSWNYSQQVEVKSSDVNLIKKLSLQLSSLVNEGINLQIQPPEFYYTNLDTLKVQIQAEAAKNAKIRAEMIAGATGKELGNMTSAKMGVLQITPLNSNQVSNYGINDVSSIEKEITGVVSATFLIE